jgi:hypothetical protein
MVEGRKRITSIFDNCATGGNKTYSSWIDFDIRKIDFCFEKDFVQVGVNNLQYCLLVIIL